MFEQDKKMVEEGFTRVTCKEAAATARAPPDPVTDRLHLDPAAIRVLMGLHRGMLSPSLLGRSIAAASASSPFTFYHHHHHQPASPSCCSTYSTLSSSSSSAYLTPTSPTVTEVDTRMRMDSEGPLESLNGAPAIRSADDLAAAGYKRAWPADKEKILLGPYDYLLSYPGKDIRQQLLVAFNTWLQVPNTSLQIITKVVAMLHTASLLVDDVEDNSNLRRGVPVAHSIFGVAQTINSANYVYFCALAELSKLNNPSVLKIFTEELLNLHRGQGMDLFWRDTLTTPSEDDYLEMVSNKTGGLFRLAVKLMQAESTSNEDYVPLVNLMGLIYQIRDDYMNLQSDQYTKNKGFCEDLTEGKFSFPIIHSIRSDASNRQLLNILKQRTTDDDVKLYAVTYMKEKTGSFEYTKQVLAELHRKANEVLEQLGGNDLLTGILGKMMV